MIVCMQKLVVLCKTCSMLMYIACLCPNLVHFYAIPILHFKFYSLIINNKEQKVLSHAHDRM